MFVLRAWTPPDDPALTVCWLRRVTHHECPTCGMTRAASHLVRGEWAAATARHPLALPLAVEAALLWLAAPLAIVRRRYPSDRTLWRWTLTHFAAFVFVWLARLAVGR
ncbi:MAG: DUF2752 domain-containing protein [Candidatus Eisenbacteria bacterium]